MGGRAGVIYVIIKANMHLFMMIHQDYQFILTLR